MTTSSQTTRGAGELAPPPATTRGGGPATVATSRGGSAGDDAGTATSLRASLAPGTVLDLRTGPVTVQGLLGASGEGEVFLVTQDDEKRAFKFYHAHARPKADVLQVWQDNPHAAVLRLFDHGVYAGRYYELMEYAAGGSLWDRRPVKDPLRLRELVRQLADGIRHLHDHQVVHKDIKPENLLFVDADGRRLVLADFGIASRLDADRSRRLTDAGFGTLDYVAPELFNVIELAQGDGRGERLSQVGKAADWYALGVTLCTVWEGRTPFTGQRPHVVQLAKSSGRIPLPADMPADLQRLVRALVAVDPEERLGHEGVMDWLEGRPIHAPKPSEGIAYPPFSFRTDAGRDVLVTDPAMLATLLADNPGIAPQFLYGRYHERVGWDKANPGLCAALGAIVEKEHPRDHAAGVTKAIYVLDPARDFRTFDGSVHATDASLAAHLEQHFARYCEELRKPNAPFWLFREVRARDVEAARRQRDGFIHHPQGPRVALNLVILHLEGIRTFRTAGAVLAEPADLLRAPVPVQERLAAALADPDSKFSLWCAVRDQALEPSIARWRAVGRSEVAALRYAFGRGPRMGDTEVTTPDRLLAEAAHRPEAFHAAAPEFDHWLRHYHATTLTELILAWLPAAAPSPLAVRALEWMVQRRDEVGPALLEVVADGVRVCAPVLEGDPGQRERMVREVFAPAVEQWLAHPTEQHPTGASRLRTLAETAHARSPQAPESWACLLAAVDHRFAALLASDLDGRETMPDFVDEIRSHRDFACDRLSFVVPGLRYIGRYLADDRAFEAERQRIAAEAAVWRREAEEVLQAEERKTLEAAKQKALDSRKFRFGGLDLVACFCLAGLLFALGGRLGDMTWREAQFGGFAWLLYVGLGIAGLYFLAGELGPWGALVGVCAAAAGIGLLWVLAHYHVLTAAALCIVVAVLVWYPRSRAEDRRVVALALRGHEALSTTRFARRNAMEDLAERERGLLARAWARIVMAPDPAPGARSQG